MYLCEVASVSQLCISFPYLLHGLCEDYLTCDIAFNAVMPLSRASTRGRYSRIEGVTPFDCRWEMDAKSNRMPCVAQKRAKAPLAKLVPLLVMMLCGMPYRIVISEMKVTTVEPFNFLMGFTSIHLVNLSTVTSR